MVDININGGVLCCSYISSRLDVTMAAHARLRELEHEGGGGGEARIISNTRGEL